MITTLRGAWPLLLGMFLLMLGNGLQGSLLGLRATLEGFPTQVTGAVMSGYYLGFLAGSTLTPGQVARVGHVRVFGALASLASTAILVHAVFVQPQAWFLIRLVTGFSYAGLYVVAESWINDRASNQTRGGLLSVYMVLMFVGLGCGQLLLNVADPAGFRLFVLVSVLVSVAVVPILLTAGPAPDFSAPVRIGLAQLYRVSPLGMVGCVLTCAAQGALMGMGAVYAARLGFSTAGVSLFMGAALLGGGLLQWPVGRLSDRFDRRVVLTVVTTLAAATAFLAIPLSSVSVDGLLVAVCVFGGLCFPMYSLCLAHTNDYLTPSQMVAASSGLVLAGGFGSVLGPISAAWLMTFAGPGGFFGLLGAVHLSIALFALFRMTRRAARPLPEQGEFVSMPPRSSPVAAVMMAAEHPEERACAEFADGRGSRANAEGDPSPASGDARPVQVSAPEQ